MINNVWLHSLLPFAVAIICLSLLLRLYKNKSDLVYKRFFITLMLMNAFQSAGYVMFSFSPKNAEWLADAYLIVLYFFFVHLVMIALSLSKWSFRAVVVNSLYIPAVILAVLHLSGLMIDSYRVEQNSLMHNDGKLSWLADVFMLGSCVVAWSIHLVNIKSIDDRVLVSKNILSLSCFAVIIIVLFSIVLLSTTDNPVSLAIAGPAISAWTAIFFFYISRKRIIDVSINLFYLLARIRIGLKFAFGGNSVHSDMTEIKKEMDKQVYIEALKAHKYYVAGVPRYNVVKTAEYLEMSSSSLYKKMKEYDIESTPSSHSSVKSAS